MLPRKPILLVFAVGIGLRLLAGPESRADSLCPDRSTVGDAATNSTGTRATVDAACADASAEGWRPAPTPLNATVQGGEFIGPEHRRFVFMTVDDRRLLLIVPQNFRVDLPNPEKVVLVNHEYSCVLSFRIVAPGNGAAAAPKVDDCRAWLSARLEDLKIKAEFSMTAASGRGPAFDLICKVDGVVRASRVTYIPSPVGVLEFISLSSPEQFEAAKADFRFMLRGFRITDAGGKLEIPANRSAT